MPLLVALVPATGSGPVRPRRAFALGLVAGAVYFAGTIYWTGGVMAQFGGLAMPVAAAVAALLVAYLALFPALFALLLRLFIARLGIGALALAPPAWVATELAREIVLGGFPWALLGYSQAPVLPVAQLASVAGVYGLSLLLVAVNAGVAYAIVGAGAARAVAPAATVAAGLLAAWWGAARVADGSLAREGVPLTVGLIQGNVAQDDKWDPGHAQEIFTRYLRLTREAAGQGATLILWPEASTPFYFARSLETELIRELARDTGAELLIGSDEWVPGTPPAVRNAAFLVRADGSVAGVYRKVHLVPFGEYVPFQDLLFFAKPLVEKVGSFEPGEGPVALPARWGPISTAICYEVIFPSLIREGVLQGSQLLTTITNDAWFGRSSAPRQHFEMAALRAIEQGRWLVRAANTGISGVVDPYGRVVRESALFETAVIVDEVRLRTALTPFARWGNLAGWTSVLLTVLALGASLAARRT